MGFLDSIERGLERAVNGAFARTFRSGVQPVEIAAALKRELDIAAVVVDRDRILVPNHFVARVSPTDAKRLSGMGPTLQRELIDVINTHSQRQSYQMLGSPNITITADDSLATGVLELDASQVESQVSWDAVLEINGTRYPLHRGATTIGRGTDCAIQITDTAASRHHLEVLWDGKSGLARDLGSTNGSKIEGQRFREAALVPGTVITIGKTALVFQLVPSSPAAASAVSRTQFNPRARLSQQSTQQPAAPQNPSGAASYGDTGAKIDQDFWRGL